MRLYREITIFANRNRVNILNKFKKLVGVYFDNLETVKVKGLYFGEKENDTAIHARQEINKMLNKVRGFIIGTETYPITYWSSSRLESGINCDVDLLNNIFNLQRLGSGWRQLIASLIDFVDRAIGIYDDDKIYAFIRTFNPFFWTFRILNYFSSIPFKFIGAIGFDESKAENSYAGKLIKGFIQLIIAIGAFLTILEKTGYLKQFLLYIGI